MAVYSYTRDIPFATHNPSTDQPDMQENTNSTDDLLDEDHFSFNETNGGLHRQVRLPLRGGSPGTIPAGLIANEGSLYTKTATSVSASTETGLFYTPDASLKEYQLTRTITAKFAKFATDTVISGGDTGGWTFLPGGMLLQYGTVQRGLSGTVDFPVDFTNVPYSIILQALGSGGTGFNLVLSSTVPPTISQFRYFSSAAGGTFFWVAIGV